MKYTRILAGVAAAALVTTLAACGSDSAKKTTSSGPNGAGGGTIASKLTLAAAPEFKTRSYGVPGLQKNYGVVFGTFKSTDAGGPLTINALKNGQADAADIYTTDPSIQANGWVILEDPKSNFAAQQVVPLINKAKATDGVKAVLNAISAKLDTTTLAKLDAKVISDKEDPEKVAGDYVKTLGLPTSGASGTIKIGSANFQENVLLAWIYAKGLSGAGATVKTTLNIGSRETYIPGLKDGSIDLIPEYTGNLLGFLDKTSTATSPDDVYAALQKALPSNLIVLDKSSAEDKDSIVVTAATAKKYNLKSIADLANKS